MEDRDPFEVPELREIDDEAEAAWVRGLSRRRARKPKWWRAMLLYAATPLAEVLLVLLVVAALVGNSCWMIGRWRHDGQH